MRALDVDVDESDEVESLDESDAIRSRECFASDDGRVTIDEDMVKKAMLL